MGARRGLLLAAALCALAAPLAAASAAKQPHRPCAVYGQAVWSPDGKQVAWASGWPDNGTVCIANADGSRLRHFSIPFGQADQIAWPLPHTVLAVDEGELISVSTTNGKASQLGRAQDFAVGGGKVATDYCLPIGIAGPIVVTDLATLRRVSIGGKKLESCVFSLSPDGRWVTFVRSATDGRPRAVGVGYWIARTDGTRLRRLEAPGPWLSFFWTPAGLWQGKADGTAERYALLFPRKTGRSILIPSRQRVAPSPNGRWLAYDTLNPSERKKGKGFTLHLFDTKTGKARTLEPRNAYLSSWSPDSRQLLVSASDPRTRCVSYWRVPVPAGRPRLVHGC